MSLKSTWPGARASRALTLLLPLLASGLTAAGAQAPSPEARTVPPTRERTYVLAPRLPARVDLRGCFTAEQLALLEKLNRRDVDHLARAEQLVRPAQFPPDPVLDEVFFSPLPLWYGWAASYPKALVIDQPTQVFGAYEGGWLVRWGPVSSGRKDRPTPAGLFHLNWRSKARHSTENPKWYMKWYFNFHTLRGLALHELELPGRPASHACVRLLARDAKWIYDWGEGSTLDDSRRKVVRAGTPVLILGTYDFASPPPWLSLAELARGIELPVDPLAGSPPPRR